MTITWFLFGFFVGLVLGSLACLAVGYALGILSSRALGRSDRSTQSKSLQPTASLGDEPRGDLQPAGFQQSGQARESLGGPTRQLLPKLDCPEADRIAPIETASAAPGIGDVYVKGEGQIARPGFVVLKVQPGTVPPFPDPPQDPFSDPDVVVRMMQLDGSFEATHVPGARGGGSGSEETNTLIVWEFPYEAQRTSTMEFCGRATTQVSCQSLGDCPSPGPVIPAPESPPVASSRPIRQLLPKLDCPEADRIAPVETATGAPGIGDIFVKGEGQIARPAFVVVQVQPGTVTTPPGPPSDPFSNPDVVVRMMRPDATFEATHVPGARGGGSGSEETNTIIVWEFPYEAQRTSTMEFCGRAALQVSCQSLGDCPTPSPTIGRVANASASASSSTPGSSTSSTTGTAEAQASAPVQPRVLRMEVGDATMRSEAGNGADASLSDSQETWQESGIVFPETVLFRYDQVNSSGKIGFWRAESQTNQGGRWTLQVNSCMCCLPAVVTLEDQGSLGRQVVWHAEKWDAWAENRLGPSPKAEFAHAGTLVIRPA